ncbi:MAG: sulfatase [Planctomycetota bacterium]
MVIIVSWAVWGGGRDDRPDVLLITIDTLRAGASKADAPMLYRIARRGIFCQRARTVTPLTLPSHASLLTGRLPPVHGMRGNTAPPLPPDRDYPLLAEEFKEAGYETAAFIASGVLDARYGLNGGFDTWQAPPAPKPGEPQFPTLDGMEQARRVTEWMAQSKGDKPRFVWVHLWDPHDPYRPRQGDPVRTRTTTASDLPADRYWGEVSHADAALEKIVKLFAQDRTVVVVTSDHGESLGEHGEATHGFLVYGATMDIPLVMAGPGVPVQGVIAGPNSIVDIAPTLRELCDLPPQRSDGFSLLAEPVVGRIVVGESLYGNAVHGWAQQSVATDGRFTLVDGGPRVELFDRDRDPRELTPAASLTGHPAYARLDRALLDYQQQKSVTSGDPTAFAEIPYGMVTRSVGGFLTRAENRKLADVATSLPADRLLMRMRTAISTRNPRVVEHLLGRIEGLEQQFPDDPAPSFTRGRALLFVLRRPQAAAEAFQEAQRRGYRSQDLSRLVAVARADAALKVEDRVEARRILQEAIDKGLGNEAMRKKLASLGG